MHLVVWRRIDCPGLEAGRLDGRRLSGTAVFIERVPCLLAYAIDLDARGATRSAVVQGWIGRKRIQVELRADARRRWTLNGRRVRAVEGATDVDFSFSPATNTLPIRRLRLAVGQQGAATAAWLRLPELALERLEQLYRRTGPTTYLYGTRDGAFRARLTVRTSGLVREYANRWREVMMK